MLTLNGITDQLELDHSGRQEPKNAVKISHLHGEEQRDLRANHQRITNRAYMKKWLVFKQTKEIIIKALTSEGPHEGKNVVRLL